MRTPISHIYDAERVDMLEKLIESLPVAIIMFKDEILTACNQKYRDYVGPEVSAILVPGLSQYDFVDSLHGIMEGIETDEPELDLLHKTDKEAWIQERLKIYKSDSTGDYLEEDGWWRSINTYYDDGTYIGLRLNVNELKQAQAAALQASRAKSEFLANMSHEIRTPMNGVIGMAQVLESSDLTQTQKEYVNIIMRSGEALLTIINDILDFSKIEAGKLEFEEKEFVLEDAAEDVIALLGASANEKNIELILDFENPSRRAVIGDVGRLRQILLNLIGNAIKFTGSGHVLVSIRTAQKGDKLDIKLSVADTGIGISKEALGKIFDQFSQADNSTTRKFGGTGLGLSITKSLVDFMGGTIKANSVLTKGTVFTVDVKLPIGGQVPAENLGISDSVLASTLKKSRVLIVDDVLENLSVLSAQLRHFGIEADKASSAKEAAKYLKLAVLNKAPYDLLISDFQMPEVDGLKLISAVRRNALFEKMKVIVLSSVDTRSVKAGFEELDDCQYHQKPVRMSILRRSIEAALTPPVAAVTSEEDRIIQDLEAYFTG